MTTNKEKYCSDIETLACQFLLGMKKLGVEEWKWFEISAYRNDLDSMCKLLVDSNITTIWFNSITFDSQVIQYIIDMQDVFGNMTNLEIVSFIYQFSQELVQKQKYEDRKLPYSESSMDIEQWDLFSILGYENQSKRTSLKWIEYSLDMPIKEMPYHHSIKHLSAEQCEEVRQYCESDIRTTEVLYYLVRGQTDNEFYKERDEIQYRIDAMKEVGLPDRAVNWSGVRLGEEIVLKGYTKESGMNLKSLWEKKKNTKVRTSFLFGECIPKYVKFKTKPFIEFYNKVKKETANVWDNKQEFPLSCNGTHYLIKKGGIHSKDPARITRVSADMIYRTADIGSQYPNSIHKRGIHPGHMGPAWNVNYIKDIDKRVNPITGYKTLGKKDPYYKGLAEVWKLVLNGGSFGKMNDRYSVQYDPFPHFSVTIGNQFEVLMLIEWLELEGIHVVSANTDGIDCYFPAELEEKYMQICNEWEVVIGNDKLGRLEYADYSMIAQTSVNDYLAVYTDGKLKTKGDFAKDRELNKNKSRRIVPIALEQYLIHNIPVEETIRNHRNIYDFCSGKKASADYYYRSIDRKTGKVTDIETRIVRYYCSTKDIGSRLYKMKRPESLKRGRPQSKCEAQSEHQVLFDIPFTPDTWNDYCIDYNYYIEETNKLLDQLDPYYRRDRKEQESKQINMF